MGYPVIHFEIGGRNAKKLQTFYSSLFGWKIDANNPMKYGVVDTRAKGKAKGINGGVFDTGGDPSKVVTVYAAVPSINPMLKKIQQAGGKVVMPRTVLPGMVTMAQFIDPSGNLVGLVEDKIPPAPKAAPKPATKKKTVSKETAKRPAKKHPVKKTSARRRAS